MTGIIIGGGVEDRDKATVRSVIVRSVAEADSVLLSGVRVNDLQSLRDGKRLAVADVFYRGKHFHVEVPVGATESEVDTLRTLQEAITEKAKAVQLEDIYDRSRIR